MFFVRVSLFFMSRGAQVPVALAEFCADDATAKSCRARHSSQSPARHDRADTPLTRAEMTRIFGDALRVR
jgi:hypothetical protein